MNVKLRINKSFLAGVFYNDRLLMNQYIVKLHLLTASENADDHDVSLERIKYFINNQLANTVFINMHNQAQCDALIRAGVKITTLPEEPIDQVIGIMLHCKLNAIAQGRMLIEQVEIASDLGEHIVYVHDTDELLGPFENAGWWTDPDSNHYDTAMFETLKIISLEQLGSGWKELDLQWADHTDPIDTSENKVVFADFQKDDSR